jgi:hypothetical protein
MWFRKRDEQPAGEPGAPDTPTDTVPAVLATVPAAGTDTTAQAETTTTRSASLLVVPLVGVTSFAIFGQFVTVYGYLDPAALDGLADITSWKWLRLVLAIGAAAVFESMALFVQYQAHAMLLLKATATAAKHRRISYGFAAVAALLQYSHFSHDDWSPTSLALMFAAFSAAGPWLWGLHTRHVRHVHLLREGQADSIGATFSAERWRAFPLDTWRARRMSIDLGIDDPRRAWATYRARPVGEVGGEHPVDVAAFAPIDVADEDEDEPPATLDQPLDWWFDEGDTEELDPRDVQDLIKLRSGLEAARDREQRQDRDERDEDERDEDDTASQPATVEEALALGWRRVRLERHFGLSEHKAKEAVRNFNAARNGHRQGAHS